MSERTRWVAVSFCGDLNGGYIGRYSNARGEIARRKLTREEYETAQRVTYTLPGTDADAAPEGMKAFRFH